MIAIGDKLPALTVTLDNEQVDLASFAADKSIILFGVPAAFSPTCSEHHVPGYVAHSEALKKVGVDAILCHSVDNHFVMAAWGKAQNTEGSVSLIADWDAALAKALGTDIDLSGGGLGVKSKRYALIAQNGEVTHMALEDNPGAHDVSSAESILGMLQPKP